jgi:enoyl-CoA hydratase/carnithine racemase
MSHLQFHLEGTVAHLVLNNPPQNRIGDQMVDELAHAVDAIGKSAARVVIVRSEGEHFSFGGDIIPWPGAPVRELRVRFARYMDVFNAFERLPLPVIAAVHGKCFGGGLELAIRADLIFAASTATFGHPEQSLGIVTLLGGIYRVGEKVGRAMASEWALTSEAVAAETMERLGVVNRVVEARSLLSEVESFAARVANGPTRAYAAHKALLRIWARGGVSAADDAMFDIAMPLFETRDAVNGLASAVSALKEGRERPVLKFSGE